MAGACGGGSSSGTGRGRGGGDGMDGRTGRGATADSSPTAAGEVERWTAAIKAIQTAETESVLSRTAAIKAIQAAETESVLSRLRLVQSYISKEQQETCALQFFQENLPNLSVVWNEKQNELELKWKDWDSHIFGDQRDDKILRASITSLPTIGGLQFSADSVQKNFIGSTGFDFNDVAWNELPEGQMAGAADALQTPGAVSNRLSFGMTPKTVRLPKNGEMLLSVHGSPLGVYKEENLAAIRESGNGSEDAAS